MAQSQSAEAQSNSPIPFFACICRTKLNDCAADSQNPSKQDSQQAAHNAQSPPLVTLTGNYTKVTIGPDDLKDYVGPPPFTSDRIYETTPPGVVMGLAWTSMGGNSLYVEAAGVEKAEGKGSLRTTGQRPKRAVKIAVCGRY